MRLAIGEEAGNLMAGLGKIRRAELLGSPVDLSPPPAGVAARLMYGAPLVATLETQKSQKPYIPMATHLPRQPHIKIGSVAAYVR